MEWVDLRSDTVTQPTAEMRQAMADAEVGDDVLGDDPTVQRLEKMAAERLGKEAALFVASGTMGNLAAILSHCQRGDEIILGHKAHTFLYEAGGVSALGGVHPRTIQNQSDGTLKLDDIQSAIRADDPHFPPSSLIVLENSHNGTGGTVLTAEYTNAVAEIAHTNGMKVHLDGSRIFNAAAALDTEVAVLAGSVDSVTFCLSKGLCAPVGSVLCGSDGFIYRARRARKQLGGGMRQVGILAAAGIVALVSMADRLSEDHVRARKLANGLKAIPEISLLQDPPPTNMVYLTIDPQSGIFTGDLIPKLAEDSIKAVARDNQTMRLVTHYWITDEGVERTIDAFRRAMRHD